jgi:putative membrane protein
MIFAIGFRLRGELPMKRLLWIAAGWSVLLATVTAYAQQNQNPTTSEPPYGYYHMWGGPWGWHAGFIFGPIMMLLVIVGIVALIVLLLRGFGYGAYNPYRHGGYPPSGIPYGRRALDILNERFAKGEIDKAEFEEKRRLIGG